jgi:hypothetical protein
MPIPAIARAALRLGLLLAGLSVTTAVGLPAPARSAAVTYDIVYVRQPRFGDDQHIVWPEVFHPGRAEPGSDLVLLHADGSEEVLVDTTDGAVTDPFVSFDGQSVYYSYFPDVTDSGINPQRGLPYAGADIYRLHLPTRQVTRLTFQEFEPNLGAGVWYGPNLQNPPDPYAYNRLGYGILNLGPAPVAGGKIVFTSNRYGFLPPKGYTNPTLQLFVMDEDGSNVTPIGPMTIGSALHPTPLADGRVMFSTFETQGLRDSRNWGLWAIGPDGRHWEPLVSSFKQAGSFHFSTQLSNGDLVVEDYYNLNNWGFGTLYRFPVDLPGGQPAFFGADPGDNPSIAQIVGNGNNPGFSYPFRMSFTPRGLYSITPFTNGNDDASPIPPGGGARVGKFTHPSAAPGNDLLVAWSPGPVNALNRPTDLPAVDAGLYLLPGGGPISSPGELALIKNDPNYNEVWPRAVVSYQAVHGLPQPALLPWLPNDGLAHPDELPAGTPYGLIGTSSLYHRESAPGVGDAAFDGLDAFNTSQNDASSNWSWQGADAGRYANADIWAVRILALEANTHRSYGPHEGQHFFNHVNEKMRILGEIPLRKFDVQGQPVLDPQGNPDTSFLARIPADTPFTFQMLDRDGLVLTMAQTWHQVRPGEARYDCGGCHAHSQQPLAFEQTAAAQPGYAVWDLTQTTPLLTQDSQGEPGVRIEPERAVNVEFYQDIRPLLQTYCVACHTGATPPGNLRLDDHSLHSVAQFTGQQAPGDYMRLCRDEDADWGYPPLVTVGGDPVWRQTNASRYVRVFQSRRSLLTWQVFGLRLDGWTNADHPTEAVPGNAGTLPPGAQVNQADLDFVPSASHPAGVGVAGMTIDEKMTFGRWIDLGCPINTGQDSASEDYGWFLDDQRPTLTVSAPRPGLSHLPVTQIRVGLADAYTGIAPGTLSLTATVPLAGRPAGAQLADLAVSSGEGIFTIPLSPPLDDVVNARLYAQVADAQGNVTRVVQTFSVESEPLFLPLVGK